MPSDLPVLSHQKTQERPNIIASNKYCCYWHINSCSIIMHMVRSTARITIHNAHHRIHSHLHSSIRLFTTMQHIPVQCRRPAWFSLLNKPFRPKFKTKYLNISTQGKVSVSPPDTQIFTQLFDTLATNFKS
jgi:hypothetical protein